MNFVEFLAPLVVKYKDENTEYKCKGQKIVDKSKLKEVILKVDSFRIEHNLLEIKEKLAKYG